MLDKPQDQWFRSPTLAGDPAYGHILAGMTSAVPGSGPILADHSGVPSLDQAERWYRARATAAYMSAIRGKLAWIIPLDVFIVSVLAFVGYPDDSPHPADVLGDGAHRRDPQPALGDHPVPVLRSGHQERVVSDGEDHPCAHRRLPGRDDCTARKLVRAGRTAARILDPAPRHPCDLRRLAHPLRTALDPHHRRQRLPAGPGARRGRVSGGRPRTRDGADRPEALPRAEKPAGGDQGAGAALGAGGLRS